jgi:hypothetical protein
MLFYRPLFIGIALSLGLFAASAVAQPGNSSPDQYGDRQSGSFGDPGRGSFGNPAAGEFDKARILEPAAGTRPMGRVHRGEAPEAPPYITLPTPSDASAAPASELPATKHQPASKSKPKKKRQQKASGDE